MRDESKYIKFGNNPSVDQSPEPIFRTANPFLPCENTDIIKSRVCRWRCPELSLQSKLTVTNLLLPAINTQCLAFMPMTSLMWTMTNKTKSHKMKQTQMLFWSFRLTSTTVQNIQKVNLNEKSSNTFYCKTSIYMKTSLGHLPKLSIFTNHNLSLRKMEMRSLNFLYLCNVLMQFEGGIQLFSSCRVHWKKSFREKARILWERNQKTFSIQHPFLPPNAYWILFRVSQLFQLFLSFSN